MSNYFKNFPKVAYRFGNEDQPVEYQKLSKYSDVIDQIKDRISTYTEYEIRDFERPETLSYRLYGTTDYEWTLFLMNERLRETGWPLAQQDLIDKIQTDFYPNYSVKLDVDSAGGIAQYANLYPKGQKVMVDGRPGVVIRKNLEVGEIIISSDDDLTTSTSLSYLVPDSDQPLTVNAPLTNTVYEYEGVHHYENDSDQWVNIYLDPVSDIVGAIPKTNLEYLVDENDASKRIRLIKKNDIEAVVAEFKRALEIR